VPKEVCKTLSFRWEVVSEISEFLSRIDMVGRPRRHLVFGYCDNFVFYTSVIIHSGIIKYPVIGLWHLWFCSVYKSFVNMGLFHVILSRRGVILLWIVSGYSQEQCEMCLILQRVLL
jgi:hypothetical protein